MTKTTTRSPGHSDVPCNACGGPTYELELGSIWCAAEDPHPGGHFVRRRAFERTPADQATYEANRGTKKAPVATPVVRPAPKRKSATDGFDQGMDGFIEGDR